MNKLSVILASLILLAVPTLFVFQIKEGQTWQERLSIPNIEQLTSRHTPRFTTGTYLPSRITKDLVITKNQSPVLLANTVTVAPGTKLTIEAGTSIFANEFASLIIEGELVIRGTAQEPVLITTNELHTTNQVWNGISVVNKASAAIIYATIEYGYPNISCLQESTVEIKNSRLTHTSMGVFKESTACTLTNTRIISRRYDVLEK